MEINTDRKGQYDAYMRSQADTNQPSLSFTTIADENTFRRFYVTRTMMVTIGHRRQSQRNIHIYKQCSNNDGVSAQSRPLLLNCYYKYERFRITAKIRLHTN